MKGYSDRTIDWTAQVALLALVCALFGRDFFNADVFYPDADHLMVDGIFSADYIRDTFANGFSHPMAYAERYYAQYPALSIGYKPPLWPAIQGAFVLVFGDTAWAMRLALLTLGSFAAIAIYRTIRPWMGPFVAVTAAAIGIATHDIAQWGWYAMTELPTIAFILGAGWAFSSYLRERRYSALAFAVLFLAAAVWCKQPGAMAAVWLGLAAFFILGPRETLVRKEIWAAVAAFAVLIVPIVLMTLHFGAMNLDQSIGGARTPQNPWEELTDYPRFLFEEHLHPVIAVIALAGIGLGIVRLFTSEDRDEKRCVIFFLCLIAANYVFFTALHHKIARYGISWIPAFGFFAAYLIEMVRRRLGMWIAGAAAAAMVAFTVYQTYDMRVGKTSGMAAAADWVIEHVDHPMVMIDAYINGQFIYFMRQKDPERRFWVIRADKVLTSSSIGTTKWLEVHAKTTDDIRDILDQYGIKTIVVEKRDLMKLAIHQTFREYLETPDFKMVAEYPMVSNRDARYQLDQTVRIYEYQRWKPGTADSITIRVPVVGKEFTVPLKPKAN